MGTSAITTKGEINIMAAVIPGGPLSPELFFQNTVQPVLEELVGKEGGKISQIERILVLVNDTLNTTSDCSELRSLLVELNELRSRAKILPPDRWRVFRQSTIESIANRTITLASCTASLKALAGIEPQIKNAIRPSLASSSSTMSAYNHLSSVMAILAAKKDENFLKKFEIALDMCSQAKAKYEAQSEVGSFNIVTFASHLNTISDLLISLGSSEKRQKFLFRCISSLFTKEEISFMDEDESDIPSCFHIFLKVLIQKDPSIFTGKFLCELIDYGLLHYMDSVDLSHSMSPLRLDDMKNLITMYLSSFDNMFFLANFIMAYGSISTCVFSTEALKFMMDSILSNSDNDRVFKLLCSAHEVNFDEDYVGVERGWKDRMAEKFAHLGHDDKAKECKEKLGKIDDWLFRCAEAEKTEQAILAATK